MLRIENTGSLGAEGDNDPRPRSQGVYLRVKRLRSEDGGDDKDVAPPLLRVRLGDGGSSSGSGCMSNAKGSPSYHVPDTFPLTELGQQPCTLQFCLLRRAGGFTCRGQETQATRKTAVASSTPVLSVERVWNLRGCVVMDCTTEAASPTDTSAPEQKGGGDTVGGAAALEDSNTWSLYVLESRHVADNKDEQERKNVEVEIEEKDEFGFDDLVVTRPNDSDEDDEISASGDHRTFVYASNCVRHHVRRKRYRDETVSDYILSMRMQPNDDGGCGHNTSPEDAALLYEMLRDHGQTCFLLEENGCDPELYMYPDHRKDDEYDSNAADFSGNEYPEDRSTSNSYVDSECTGYDVGRHRERRQEDGWYEESYREASLGSGWNSCDENY